MKKVLSVIVILLSHMFYSSLCQAGYLLTDAEGNSLEFDQWVRIQRQVQEQIWMEGRDQGSLTLEEDITILFVPPSLLQAYALYDMYQTFSTTHPHRSFIDIPDCPFMVDDPEESIDDFCLKLRREEFSNGSLDAGLVAILNKTSSEDPARHYVNFSFSNVRGLQDQHRLEFDFLKKYAPQIRGQQFEEILNDFYPPFQKDEKKPHFLNLVKPGEKLQIRNKFLKACSFDRENLIRTIAFEVEAEHENKIALLRGTNGIPFFEDWFFGKAYPFTKRTPGIDPAKLDPLDRSMVEDYNQRNKIHVEQDSEGKWWSYQIIEEKLPEKEVSVAFGAGYYSGIFVDSTAMVSLYANTRKYFCGLKVPRQIFSEHMIIPPLTWHKPLGMREEFFHPRTTVAIDTPLDERTQAINVAGTNVAHVCDNLGLFIREGDMDAHHKVVRELLQRNMQVLNPNE